MGIRARSLLRLPALAFTTVRDGLYELKDSPRSPGKPPAARKVNNACESCRDLWLIYVAKALESYSYFSLSLIYVIYLTDEFGVSDLSAGGSYGIWGMLIVAWGVVLGPLIDYLGVKLSLLLCFSVEMVVRFVLATTTSLNVIYLLLYSFLPAAGALGVPVMTIGVKRYTTPATRGLAFGLFYTVMNVAALLNGVLMDVFRRLCDGLAVPGLPDDHWLNNGNRLFMASGAVSSLLGFVVTLFMADAATERQCMSPVAASAEAPHHPAPCASDDSPLAPTPDSLGSRPPAGKALTWRSVTAYFQSKAAAAAAAIADLGQYAGFWKYLVFALFMINLRQVYRYLDALMPKFMQRAFGCDAPVGSVYSINPGMIVVLVPIVSALTTAFQHFDMIHYGSFLSAGSPFWIVASPTVAGTAMFVVTLSLGEAVWSPRWYDYTMDIAPAGKEGLFGAVASAPLFLAKLPTGLLSGWLLEEFCPVEENCSAAESKAACGGGDGRFNETAWGGDDSDAGVPEMPLDSLQALEEAAAGSCQGQTLWLVIGVLTMMTPVLVTVFRSWLKPDAKEEGQYQSLGEEDGSVRSAAGCDVRVGLDAVSEGMYEGSSRPGTAERGLSSHL